RRKLGPGPQEHLLHEILRLLARTVRDQNAVHHAAETLVEPPEGGLIAAARGAHQGRDLFGHRAPVLRGDPVSRTLPGCEVLTANGWPAAGTQDPSTFRCRSLTSSGSTSLGLPSIGLAALAVLGNAIVSRMSSR